MIPAIHITKTKVINRLFTLVILLGLATPQLFFTPAQASELPGQTRSELNSSTEKSDIIVHLFEWKWSDIAKECQHGLGGVGAVQVSPPQEHREVTDFPVDYEKDGKHYTASVDYPWWQRYQPVTYKVNSRSGDTEDFINMVNVCHAAGIDIIADVVINHMASASPEKGNYSNDGKQYWPYWFDQLFPNGYNPFEIVNQNYDDDSNDEDFHTSWDTDYGEALCPYDDMLIHNYNSDVEVWNCELGTQAPALPDLRTGQEITQKKIATYLVYLVQEMGVDGFRIDAAKHIHHNDIQAILGLVKDEIGFITYNNLTIFQEVIEAEGQPIQGGEYTDTGMVTEFQYGQELARAFSNNGDLSWLAGLDADWVCPDSNNDGNDWENCMLDGSKAVVFVNNHDNQRGHGSSGVLTYKEGEQYQLANIFMLAWPYGTPVIMSSYEFGNGADHQCEWNGDECILHDWEGPPSDGFGNTEDIYLAGVNYPNCSTTGPGEFTDGGDDRDGWVCEHRWFAIEEMIAFHNIVGNEPVENFQSEDGDRIAFSRGDQGFVIINNTDSAWTVDSVNVNLPSDSLRYIDLIHPFDESAAYPFISIDDSGHLITVDKDGNWSGEYVSVEPYDAVVLVNGYTLETLQECAASFLEWFLDALDNVGRTGVDSTRREALTSLINTYQSQQLTSSTLTPQQISDILYLFRDRVMANTSNGRTMITKYYRYSPELVAIILERPTLGEDLWSVLKWGTPSLDRYMSGRTSRLDVFTRERYDQLERIYNIIRAMGSRSLANDITSYWNRVPLRSYVGQTMDTVIGRVISLLIGR